MKELGWIYYYVCVQAARSLHSRLLASPRSARPHPLLNCEWYTVSKGKKYSLLLHIVLMIFMIFGLPDFLHRKIASEPMAISVEILPIAPISNVKPQEKAEPKEEKKPIEEKRTARKAVQETKKAEEKPAEIPIKISAKDVVIPVKKKPESKPVRKPEKKIDDLDAILKSVEQNAKAEESKKPTEKAVKEPEKNTAKSENYDNTAPLSMSETDAIRNQFQKCWIVPAGAKDAANLIVTLHITLNEDGSVVDVQRVGDQNRYNSDSFFQAATDSAIRAVRKCSPLKNLPTDKYSNWREMDLTFNPKDML